MGWRALPHNIWTQPTRLDRVDPYLWWADATDFRGMVSRPQTVPALLELSCPVPDRSLPHVARSWMRTLRAQLGAQRFEIFIEFIRIAGVVWMSHSRFISLAAAPPKLFKALAWDDLAKIFKRVECCLPVASLRDDVKTVFSFDYAEHAADELLLGVIDDGAPFAHTRLRDAAGQTRFRWIWSQGGPEELGTTKRPAQAQYGYEADCADLTTWSAAASGDIAYLRDARYPAVRPLASHGAHVLDLLAGVVPHENRLPDLTTRQPPSFEAEPARPSSKAPLVFVQLARKAVQDNSGRWLGSHVLDGLRYILSKADEPGGTVKRIVVNVSYGPQTGPRDGSSMLERAIDELQRLDNRLTVVLPAGNSFQSGAHAQLQVPAGQRRGLQWQLPPSSEAPAFAEIWLPAKADPSALTFTLRSPAGTPSPAVPADGAFGLYEGTDCVAAVIFLKECPQAEGRALALFCVAPTFAFDGHAVAPHGQWSIEVHNAGSHDITLQAHIARNGTDLGAKLRGRPSYFVDADYDPLRYLREASDDPKPARSPVQRRGTVNGVGTGAATVVVAGFVRSDRSMCDYSSAGPTDGPYRDGPTISVATDESPALKGLLAAGTRSGSAVRLVGTSAGAPLIARRIADQTSLTPPIPKPKDPEREGTLGKCD